MHLLGKVLNIFLQFQLLSYEFVMDFLRSIARYMLPNANPVQIENKTMLSKEDQVEVNPTIISQRPQMLEHQQQHAVYSSRPDPVPEEHRHSHGRFVLKRWDKFLSVLSGRDEDSAIDGDSLDIATIVAVAR